MRLILIIVTSLLVGCAPSKPATIDEQLSMLDGGSAKPDAVLPYRVRLDLLEARCEERRDRIGDFAYKGSTMLTSRGRKTSSLDMLQMMVRSIPKDSPKLRCAEVSAAVVTMLSQ